MAKCWRKKICCYSFAQTYPNLCLCYDLQSYQSMMRTVVWHVKRLCFDVCSAYVNLIWTVNVKPTFWYSTCMYACNDVSGTLWTWFLLGLNVPVTGCAHSTVQQYSRVAFCAVYKMTVIVWTDLDWTEENVTPIITPVTCFMCALFLV